MPFSVFPVITEGNVEPKLFPKEQYVGSLFILCYYHVIVQSEKILFERHTPEAV